MDGQETLGMERSFEIRTAERKWLEGGPPLPLIRMLAETDQPVKAAAIARLVLTRPDCPDRREIEAILDQLDRAPAGWEEALQQLARNPTLEGWEALMRFNPGDLAYNRQRNALRKLRGYGVDASLLFRFATQLGITPEAMELVEDGLVTPKTILKRSEESTGAQAYFLGLAAEAVFLRGDMIGTVRLLRQAYSRENESCAPDFAVFFIRERASEEQHAALDNAGIPRL